jgi:hypothetical protein
MTWLLKLYPPRWRRRYGAELADVVAAQPFSIGTAIDLIAGAIDAWFNPQLIAAVSDVKGDLPMVARILQLKCAGFGPNVTPADRVKNVTINIGGTLVFALVWLALVWVWKRGQIRGNAYLMALSPMAYLFPYLVSLHYTSLKGRSGGAQTVLIGGVSVVIVSLLLLAGWISTKL